MAEKLDPKDLLTLDELALSNMWETSALVELLERKGVLTRRQRYCSKKCAQKDRMARFREGRRKQRAGITGPRDSVGRAGEEVR